MNNKLLAVMMNLLAIACGLALMGASAWLITSASFHPPLSTLALGITLVRAAGLFRAVFRYFERYLTHTAIFDELTKIRLRLYKFAFMKFPLKSGATGEAELLHDLTVGADLLKDFFPRALQPIISTSIIVTFVTAYLYKIIDICAIALPLSLSLTLIISYAFANLQEVDDTVYREKLLDFYDCREGLIVADGIEIANEKLNEETENLRRYELTNFNKMANVDSACALMSAAVFVFLLMILSLFVDIVDLAVWTFILLMTVEMFNALPDAVRNFFRINRCSKTFSPVELENQNNNKNFSQATSHAIEINDVCFSYSPVSIVLKNLNLKVKHGEKIAIIGESGSGKTTLLYLLMRLWNPDSGQIIIDGSTAASTTNNYIFSKSIRENFQILHPNITEEQILNALRICQLKNFDIDRELGENGCKISGGERTRLQIALAFAADSEILILDEPTAGLDVNTKENLMHEIINIANEKDRTLIVITHDLSVASMMNCIYKLYDGKFVKIICAG